MVQRHDADYSILVDHGQAHPASRIFEDGVHVPLHVFSEFDRQLVIRPQVIYDHRLSENILFQRQ